MFVYETIKLKQNSFTIKMGNTKENTSKLLDNRWENYEGANFWTKFLNSYHSHDSEDNPIQYFTEELSNKRFKVCYGLNTKLYLQGRD